MSHLVAAILTGQVTETNDGHLQLHDGKVWPGFERNVLFVRDFYKAFSSRMVKYTDACVTIIEGTPGIGKSSHGLYLLYQLLTNTSIRNTPWRILVCQSQAWICCAH
jgi:hypothetical protein